MTNIDWDKLRTEAISAMKRAYAPYSKFPVGVAAKTDDGRIVTGCNVENASYGLGLCAECGLVSNLVLGGRSIIRAIYCVDANGNALSPCGRCRQLLWEHTTFPRNSMAVMLCTESCLRSTGRVWSKT